MSHVFQSRRIRTAVMLSLSFLLGVAQPALAVSTIGLDLATEGNATLGDGAADLVTVNGTIQGASLVFEGSGADAFETTLAITDGADVTITLPSTTGTVITSGDVGS